MTNALATPERTPLPTTIDDLRDLATCDVWSATSPNAAGLLGMSRDLAYDMARRGDLPVIRLGAPGSRRPRIRVKVLPLLEMVGAGVPGTPDAA